MRVEYAKRRDYIVGRLRKIPGVSCGEPQGAFYVFPNVSALYGKKYQGKAITGSNMMAETLLEKAHIATVPGGGFGADAYIRLSYATSMEKIEKGLDRLEKFVKELA
jgi:aspartate aminotransferase